MKVVSRELQREEFLGGDLLAGRVATAIESRSNDEPSALLVVPIKLTMVSNVRVGRPRQLIEMKEKALLNLVPLTPARREATDVERDVQLIGDSLQLVLPDVRPEAVTASGVGSGEELARAWVAFGAVTKPTL